MDLQTYVDFNRHCANILDHCDKVCFALTLIQGQNVRGWKLKMVAWVARQYNDIITWNNFLHQFGEQFLDSQREQTAKVKIEHIQIKDNEMDQYISIFEELANKADYDIDSKPVMNLFQKSLNYKLNSQIFSFFPAPQNWEELKAMAVRASNTEGNLKAFHDNPFG